MNQQEIKMKKGEIKKVSKGTKKVILWKNK